jgi:hypothetical protein
MKEFIWKVEETVFTAYLYIREFFECGYYGIRNVIDEAKTKTNSKVG